MTKHIVVLLVVLSTGCANNKPVSEVVSIVVTEPGDTTRYESLSNGFYRGTDGNIFIKTRSLIRPPEEYSEPFFREVPVADYQSYTNISGYYAKDKIHVYWDWATTDGRNISIIEEADAETFEVIHYRLGKDKDHVFYNGNIVEGVNVDVLVVLCDNPNSDFLSSYGLYKDDQYVYYDDRKLKSIDAATFECVSENSTIIYQDRNWVYEEDYFPDEDPGKRQPRE